VRERQGADRIGARIFLQGEFFYLQFIGCLISFEKWYSVALFIGNSMGYDFIGDLRAFCFG